LPFVKAAGEPPVEVSRPHARELTPEELQELEKFKRMIEHAVADGKISKQDIQDLQKVELSSGKQNSELLQHELELYRTLVTEKLQTGELEYDY
jgi:methanogenic corrinoid protein MtbC1